MIMSYVCIHVCVCACVQTCTVQLCLSLSLSFSPFDPFPPASCDRQAGNHTQEALELQSGCRNFTNTGSSRQKCRGKAASCKHISFFLLCVFPVCEGRQHNNSNNKATAFQNLKVYKRCAGLAECHGPRGVQAAPYYISIGDGSQAGGFSLARSFKILSFASEENPSQSSSRPSGAKSSASDVTSWNEPRRLVVASDAGVCGATVVDIDN